MGEAKTALDNKTISDVMMLTLFHPGATTKSLHMRLIRLTTPVQCYVKYADTDCVVTTV